MPTGAEPPKHPALSIEIEHALVGPSARSAPARRLSRPPSLYDLLGMIAADGHRYPSTTIHYLRAAAPAPEAPPIPSREYSRNQPQ